MHSTEKVLLSYASHPDGGGPPPRFDNRVDQYRASMQLGSWQNPLDTSIFGPWLGR
jgi:hypothetical protein